MVNKTVDFEFLHNDAVNSLAILSGHQIHGSRPHSALALGTVGQGCPEGFEPKSFIHYNFPIQPAAINAVEHIPCEENGICLMKFAKMQMYSTWWLERRLAVGM